MSFFNLLYFSDRPVAVCHSSDMATYQTTEDELVLLHSVDEFERYIDEEIQDFSDGGGPIWRR